MVKHKLYKVSGLFLTAALIIPLFASAQSNSSLTNQIQSLMSQITSLEQQLHTLVQTSVGSTTSGWGAGNSDASTTPPKLGGPGSVPCPMIARDLSIGSQGSDVSELQQMLQGQGFLTASSTGFFGSLTAAALARYQSEMGLATSTGFFGPLTRNFLNGHCGGSGDGSRNGTSTPPTWPGGHATSTPGWGDGRGPATSSDNGGGWHGWPINPAATTTSGGPCMQPYSPPSDSSGSGSAHTNILIMRPCGATSTPPHIGPFWNGSTTSQTPCPQASIQNGADLAAVAAALFTAHTILPGIGANPCPNGPMNGGQGVSGN